MTSHDGGTVRWHAVAVPGIGHRIPVRVYEPPVPPSGWLVWAHGGSWTAGSVADWHPACADLAAASGCTVVSVDYRLAPAHRHPAAVRDVLAVASWVEETAGPVPIVVGGDSAGGTIAACAALVRRDQQGRPFAGQVLAYPPLDPDCRATSFTRFPDGFPSRDWMLTAWRAYRGSRPDPTWYSTPFEVADLAGAPAAVLAVGDRDPVGDDTIEYARRLRASGCAVTLRRLPMSGHGTFPLPGPGAELRGWLGNALRPLLTKQHTRGATS
ncbi:MAG TPA: alpha/beta hydrolase [Pseudonocardiaceae bacterium]|nr:alpha/beta hydrolase [Pseudonocardiaceae bacterium]